MKRVFNSRFAGRMAAFVAEKHALGYPYNDSGRILANFDRFCTERFPDSDALSKEVCLAWAVRRDTEEKNCFRNRLSVVREFARYLNRIGEQAYVIPATFAKKGARPTPHIYSEEEVAAIWKEFDSIKPRGGFPVRHIVLPAIVRLLYCCGLRPCEARKLKADDINLFSGKLYIRESKGRKDRIVMLADDVRDYMRDYNEQVCRHIPGREWFFPNSVDGLYTKEWLEKEFRMVRAKLNLEYGSSNPPRLYDFRHTFATHSLYRWLREGKDLTAMLPYLSAYMGHSQLSDTFYYIHLVPGQLEAMSGLDFPKYEALLPEVECHE